MRRTPIPIKIEKIKVEEQQYNHQTKQQSTTETVKYLFEIIEERGQQWIKTFICDRESLLDLKEKIDKLLADTTTSEILKISSEKAQIVDAHYKTDKLCQNCSYKLTGRCITCLFTLQSPLERQLYLELSKSYINFQTQYALNWRGEHISTEGKSYGNPHNNFKEVLTIVDFYIEKRQTKLCVYTDGHTYHERTEEQAQRDRNIDRKLQELGFTVLRYTGKEVNENCTKIIQDIKKWIE